MLVNMNGKEYDCKLVRIGKYLEIDDCRNVALCEKTENCETCMWNTQYAEKRMNELELQEMTTEEIDSLKQRNVSFPIKADSLRCYKPKEV